MKKIYSEVYSRIPIYEKTRENIVGILMARDLIMINIDLNILTIKQISSIIVRDVLLIDQGTKLQPIMSYFKKGDTHMGIVTQVVQEDGRDPELKKIGIITLEDIIEELLSEEIEDEAETDKIKEDRKRVKDKLQLLFSDH